MINRRYGFILTALAALLFSGCNTLQGIGKDIEKGGQAIGKAAR